MGWALVGSPEQRRQGCGQPPGESPYSSRGYSCPHYSTDIAAAWEVVEKFQAEDFDVRVGFCRWRDDGRVGWLAWVGKADALADTAPHAICLAALKAVE